MEDIWERVVPAAPLSEQGLSVEVVAAAVVAGLLAVALPVLWRAVRVGVTVVHELGHAIVGVLCGRKFTGLVLRPDMSGHVVTVGRNRGPGRVLTTWAGYPAPGVVGLGLIGAAWTGWAPPVLLGCGLLLLAGLLRVRSVYSALVMAATTAGVGWLWWAGDPRLQGLVLLAVGVVLLLGAWRHLAAAVRGRARSSDAAVLGRITPVPAAVWTASFVLVLGGASWAAGWILGELVASS